MKLHILVALQFIFSTFYCFYPLEVEAIEISGRIINGRRAKLGQFPWQVLLKHVNERPSACGASLISPTWVLTAAHCVNEETKLLLMFGTVDLVNSSAVNMTSSQLHVHPNYTKGSIIDDVGLIELPEAVQLNEYVKTIKLPSVSLELDDFINDTALTSGFGLRDDVSYQFPEHLYYTKLQIISNKQCSDELNQPIGHTTMCAKGYKGIHSVCRGDSGSAIVRKDDEGDWIQIGVTSFVAAGLCTKGYPAGFARVTDILEWIHDVSGIELAP